MRDTVKHNLSESQFITQFPAALSAGCLVTLDAEESQHAVKVFRHRTGDILRLGDGCGIQAQGILRQASADACQLEITDFSTLEERPRVHLAIAALKDNDLEEVMDSCGQLALASMTLLRTAHSQEPRDSDLKRTLRRLELKSRVAFKQSLKPWITTVQGPFHFADWQRTQKAQVVLCDLDGNVQLEDSLRLDASRELVLAVGPEGGFSPEEIQTLKSAGAALLGLGQTRLRAKTCPIVALGALLGMGLAT